MGAPSLSPWTTREVPTYSFISALSPFVLTHPGCAQSSGRTKLLVILDFSALFDLRTFAHAIVCLELVLLQLTPYSSDVSLVIASYNELSLKSPLKIW